MQLKRFLRLGLFIKRYFTSLDPELIPTITTSATRTTRTATTTKTKTATKTSSTTTTTTTAKTTAAAKYEQNVRNCAFHKTRVDLLNT